jgi:hypothetical protein
MSSVFVNCSTEWITIISWCSIKDDYRTLVDLEVVNVVNPYMEIDEDECFMD